MSTRMHLIMRTLILYLVSVPAMTLACMFSSRSFYMPHGLHIDQSTDVFWVTDVALHQVMSLKAGSNTPLLVLGERLVPGSGSSHFCKPTDVATLASGDIFVSDGFVHVFFCVINVVFIVTELIPVTSLFTS